MGYGHYDSGTLFIGLIVAALIGLIPANIPADASVCGYCAEKLN